MILWNTVIDFSEPFILENFFIAFVHEKKNTLADYGILGSYPFLLKAPKICPVSLTSNFVKEAKV